MSINDFISARRFLPLLLVQFLEAFNVNLYKNALFILVTFQSTSKVFTSLGGGILILPYLLFSVLAGQLADKYEKTQLIRIIKIIEVLLMATAMWTLSVDRIVWIYCVLFFLGVHATFLSPIKYAILPQLIAKNDLVLGNAWIEASTFLAILIGTILGGVLIQLEHGVMIVSGMLGVSAAIGLCVSYAIPHTVPSAPLLKIEWNFISKTSTLLCYAKQNKSIWYAILGISWIWFLGVTFLTLFPSFAKDTLHANAHVVTLFLTIFSLGVGAGSMVCGRVMHAKLRMNYVSLSCLCMTIPMIDLWFASRAFLNILTTENVTVALLLSYFEGWRIAVDLLLTAMFAGFYVVPLYTLLQTHSKDTYRAQMIACSNVMNSIFMISSAILTASLLSVNIEAHGVFAVVGILNISVAFYSSKFQKIGVHHE